MQTLKTLDALGHWTGSGKTLAITPFSSGNKPLVTHLPTGEHSIDIDGQKLVQFRQKPFTSVLQATCQDGEMPKCTW